MLQLRCLDHRGRKLQHVVTELDKMMKQVQLFCGINCNMNKEYIFSHGMLFIYFYMSLIILAFYKINSTGFNYFSISSKFIVINGSPGHPIQ